MAAPTVNTGHQIWSDTSNTTTTTAPLPTTLGGSDRWFVAIASDPTSQAFTPPDGNWTEEWDALTAQSAFTYYLAYRLGGSADAAFGLGTSERCAGVSFAVTGAASGFHAKGTDRTGSSNTAIIPGLTTTVANCLVVGILYADPSAGDVAFPTTLSGWTYVNGKYQASGGAVAVYERTQATPGEIVDTNVTLAVSEQWSGISFALAPEAGIVSLSANAAITTAINAPVLAVNRRMVANANVVSDIAVPALSVSRSMVANAAIVTNISAPALVVLRRMTANAAIVSFISAPNGIYYLRLVANAAIVINISAPALAVLRRMLANVAIVSNISAPVFLGTIALAANAAIITNISAPALAVNRRLVANANVVSSIGFPTLAITRRMAVSANIATNISLPILAVTRRIAANASITSNINLARLGIVYAMFANASITTNISQPQLSVLRRMLASVGIVTNLGAPILILVERAASTEVQIVWGFRVPTVRWARAVRNRYQE